MKQVIFCLGIMQMATFAQAVTSSYRSPVRDVLDYGRLDSLRARVVDHSKVKGEWGFTVVEKTQPEPTLMMYNAEAALSVLKRQPEAGSLRVLMTQDKNALLNAAHVYLEFLGVEHSVVSFVPSKEEIPLWRFRRDYRRSIMTPAEPKALLIHPTRTSKLGKIAQSYPGSLIFDPEIQLARKWDPRSSLPITDYELRLGAKSYLALSAQDLVDLRVHNFEEHCSAQF